MRIAAIVITLTLFLSAGFYFRRTHPLPSGPSGSPSGSSVTGAAKDLVHGQNGSTVNSAKVATTTSGTASTSSTASGASSSATSANAPSVATGSGATATGLGTSATPGIPGTPGTASAPVATTPAQPTTNCFVLTYHHKTLASHPNEEACSHHKNIVALKHAPSPKTVCVRVNNIPVKFETVKGKPNQLLFGAVAGPDSVVSVRYCTGKPLCTPIEKDGCTVPKDEFMDAIGASGEEEQSGAVSTAQWDSDGPATGADAKLKADVKKELSDIDDDSAKSATGGVQVFQDWIGDNEAAACMPAQKVSAAAGAPQS